MKHKFSIIELILGITFIVLIIQQSFLENFVAQAFGLTLKNNHTLVTNYAFSLVILGAFMIINSFKSSIIFFKTPSFLRGLTALVCDIFFMIFFIFETDISPIIKVIISLASTGIYFNIASYERSFIPLILITSSLIALFVFY